MTHLKNKPIEDCSNTIRVQYTADNQAPSSITIDELLFKLLEKQVVDVKGWLKEKAREKRAELLKEANELAKTKSLYKKVGKDLVEITPDEFIRGKVSAAVRESVILEIAKESLITQIKVSDNQV